MGVAASDNWDGLTKDICYHLLTLHFNSNRKYNSETRMQTQLKIICNVTETPLYSADEGARLIKLATFHILYKWQTLKTQNKEVWGIS